MAKKYVVDLDKDEKAELVDGSAHKA